MSIFGKNKIFCIGRNKTGTTSLESALKELGFRVGNQPSAELLLMDWGKRNFKPIIKYCRSADAFQDLPFSLPFTFQALDLAYPNSKFILTIRDSAEQWYESLITFHSKLFGKGRLPSRKDLENALYRYRGFMNDGNRLVYGTPYNEPYKKNVLIAQYTFHNKLVKEYFRNRSDDLLVINISHSNAYFEMCNFIGVKPVRDSFPWENKTENINIK